MEDLNRFTNLLFGDLQGLVYSPAKGDTWTQKFFEWPKEALQLHDWIMACSHDSDVYLSPVLYKERQAVKSAIKYSQVVWVEFDGDTEIDFRDVPIPSAIVQTSSSTHLHAYWKTDELNVQTLEDINRRLTLYLRADSSGWDATQLLRPPDTWNHKYTPSLPVKTSHFVSNPTPVGAFQVAPRVVAPTPVLEHQNLLSAKKVLLAHLLSPSLRKKINEEVAPVGSRSSFLARIALELAEEGLFHQEITSILHHVDERVGKFALRTDRLERLSSLAEFALLKVNTEDETVVYDFQQILDHTESLDWILEGWLHTSGFLIITGAPSVGKTQLCLQFAVDLTSKQQFLGKKILGKDISVLILSLEMDFRQIKFVLLSQSEQWDPSFDKTKIQVVDENGGLTGFETLIEKYQPSVVIIDSLSELLEEGPKADEQAKAVMRWIRKVRRRYNCAIVAIHHNRKATEGNKKPNKLSDLYGSFHFARVVETILCLWDEGQRLELSTIKTRFGPKDKFYIRRNQYLNYERIDDKSVDRKSTTDREPESGSGPIKGFGH